MKQLEMTEPQIEFAEKVAKRLGYTQTAYTSTSELIGLYCIRDRQTQKACCLVQTPNLGLIAVYDLEDLNLYDLANEQRATYKKQNKRAKQIEKENGIVNL